MPEIRDEPSPKGAASSQKEAALESTPTEGVSGPKKSALRHGAPVEMASVVQARVRPAARPGDAKRDHDGDVRGEDRKRRRRANTSMNGSSGPAEASSPA